jgi:predicted naringenin-chalcone synthase
MAAMSFAIVSLGTAVPATIVDQADASEVAKKLCCRTEEQATWLPTIYAGTGVRTRRLTLDQGVLNDSMHGTQHSGSVFLPKGGDDRGPTTAERMQIYQTDSVRLGLEASGQALRQGGWSPREVTHLITVSCTGFFAPGIDYALMQGLGLLPTTSRTHVGFMGCHGALNGLRVAQAYAGSDPDARILLCAVELCSLHYYYGWDPQKVIANAIFGDGCAALAGMPAAAAPGNAWTVTATGSFLIPNSADAMTWTIGDHGFEMSLSKKVPGLIAQNLRPGLTRWLDRNGLQLNEIGSWAIHPGGPRILGAVEDALGLNAEQTATAREVFAEFGNMSSPTVLFIIERLRRDGAARPCVALGFGPGLVAEAALFR